MKKFISILSAALFILIGIYSCQLGEEKAKRPQFTEEERIGVESTNERPKVDNINLNTFKDLYNTGKYMIIDARTQREYLQGHLPEAILLDIDAADFETVASSLDTNRAYLVYSHKGIRSVKVMTNLKGKGVSNITNLIGSISNWQLKNYPWTK